MTDWKCNNSDCLHEWEQRGKKTPHKCPRCGSTNVSKIDSKVGEGGTPSEEEDYTKLSPTKIAQKFGIDSRLIALWDAKRNEGYDKSFPEFLNESTLNYLKEHDGMSLAVLRTLDGGKKEYTIVDSKSDKPTTSGKKDEPIPDIMAKTLQDEAKEIELLRLRKIRERLQRGEDVITSANDDKIEAVIDGVPVKLTTAQWVQLKTSQTSESKKKKEDDEDKVETIIDGVPVKLTPAQLMQWKKIQADEKDKKSKEDDDKVELIIDGVPLKLTPIQFLQYKAQQEKKSQVPDDPMVDFVLDGKVLKIKSSQVPMYIGLRGDSGKTDLRDDLRSMEEHHRNDLQKLENARKEEIALVREQLHQKELEEVNRKAEEARAIALSRPDPLDQYLETGKKLGEQNLMGAKVDVMAEEQKRQTTITEKTMGLVEKGVTGIQAHAQRAANVIETQFKKNIADSTEKPATKKLSEEEMQRLAESEADTGVNVEQGGEVQNPGPRRNPRPERKEPEPSPEIQPYANDGLTGEVSGVTDSSSEGEKKIPLRRRERVENG